MKQLKDFRERRSFNDRRKFTYTAHAPERRSGADRRRADADKLRLRIA